MFSPGFTVPDPFMSVTRITDVSVFNPGLMFVYFAATRVLSCCPARWLIEVNVEPTATQVIFEPRTTVELCNTELRFRVYFFASGIFGN